MELTIALAACGLVMASVWAWQIRFQRADWVDAAWAALIGLQAVGFALAGEGAVEKRLLGALLALTWSIRLVVHLVQRLAAQDREDGRYRAMREHFGVRANWYFLPFFLLQALKSRGEAYREYQRTTSPFIPWPPKG